MDRFHDRALVGVEVGLDELPQRPAVRIDLGGAADDLELPPMRVFAARELRALRCSFRTGSLSARTSRNHSCSSTGASPSSPFNRRSQSARSSPLLVENGRYTVFSDTSASPAIASMVVAG
jgi:hypothetical protein